MAPPAADVDIASYNPNVVPVSKKLANSNNLTGPLKYSGSLDQYKSFDVTNVIGREFPELQLSDILNDDNKIRDLAITGKMEAFFERSSTKCNLVSQRGVVFFRNQSINIEDQKLLGQKLGELTGKPESSKVILPDPHEIGSILIRREASPPCLE